jgi:hypothetical protein
MTNFKTLTEKELEQNIATYSQFRASLMNLKRIATSQKYVETTEMVDSTLVSLLEEKGRRETIASMTEVEQLKHRLAMVMDDIKVINKILEDNKILSGILANTPTAEADSFLTHLSNIEIASDLNDDASLEWKLFNSTK